MTNVTVHNPRFVVSQRFLLALAFGAGFMSLLLLGTANNRLAAADMGREVLSPSENNQVVVSSPFMLDSQAMSFMQSVASQQAEATGFFNLRASLVTHPDFFVHESDDAVAVTVDVPSTVNLEEIQVEVRDGSVLHIKGGHKDKFANVEFEKTFALGRHVDADAITATLSGKGMLTVKAPKVPKKAPEIRSIDVMKIEL